MFSPFEALMVICFGTAWPVSIWKSYTARRNEGKSFGFLCIIFGGYLSGVLHKALFNPDPVIVLYILNAVMVFADICIYIRNDRMMLNIDVNPCPPSTGSAEFPG